MRDLDDETLAGLAADLGADVPMCLLSKPVRVEGIGEILTRWSGFPPSRSSWPIPASPFRHRMSSKA
ncbi:MAG: hypothetical protein HPM95_20380 [Alphaproteobacteria bacterium]|nr:hypothetical protein [Alphaproteobacteria bacterium]